MINETILYLLYMVAGIGGILLLCAGGTAIHYYCTKRKNTNIILNQGLLNNNEPNDNIDNFP
jgi:hypothetical protein